MPVTILPGGGGMMGDITVVFHITPRALSRRAREIAGVNVQPHEFVRMMGAKDWTDFPKWDIPPDALVGEEMRSNLKPIGGRVRVGRIGEAVKVDKSRFVNTHGREPQGRGTWGFAFDG
ncbi:MAG: hypothetical protein GWN89_05635, partial [Thermoplasmata archaeon]|nr:hypothetical protein [Thermoplasmata archaeon]